MAATGSLYQPFWTSSLLSTYAHEYEKFSTELRERGLAEVYMTKDTQLASILTYIYDIPTVLISAQDLSGLEDNYSEKIWVIGSETNDSYVSPEGIRLGRGSGWCGEYTERVRGKRPEKYIQLCRSVELTQLNTGDEELCAPATMLASDTLLHSRVGRKDLESGTITSLGTPGVLQYGPYVKTTPGKYRVTWHGRAFGAEGENIGLVDVVADKGKTVIARQRVDLTTQGSDERGLAILEFVIHRDVVDLEFRFMVTDAIVVLEDIKVECFI